MVCKVQHWAEGRNLVEVLILRLLRSRTGTHGSVYRTGRRVRARGLQGGVAALDRPATFCQPSRLKAGGTANDIAAAQADVDKAQAALDKLKAGPEVIPIRKEA